MSINSIWWCKLHLKKVNPKKTSRTRFVYDHLECLVILNEDLEYVELITNNKVVGRNITKECGNKFTKDDIYKIEPISNHGKSNAKQ